MRREVPAEALQQGAEGPRPVVVDVRSAAEYAAGHVPEAVSIPLDELEARRSELPRGRPIVAYCNLTHPGSARCERAADLLSSHGHDAAILAGGFMRWRDSGRPVARGGG